MRAEDSEGRDRLREEHVGCSVPSGGHTDTAGYNHRGDREQSALHPALESTFAALNLAGISWCMVRLPSNLAAPTGDVDLLVDRADEGRTGRILRTLGFGRLPVWGRRNPEAFYLLYHPATGHNVCLHVATEVSFGSGRSIQTDAAAGCLQRRRRCGLLFEPHPDDAFWMLLLHCLLDKGAVPSRYRASLHELAASVRDDSELAGMVEKYFPAGWDASKIAERVSRGDWASLERLARDLKESRRGQPFDHGLQSVATLFAMLSSQSVRRYAWRKARSLVLEVWPRLRSLRQGLGRTGGDSPATHRGSGRPLDRRSGLTVALLGPDGVGKSTLAASLKGAFPNFSDVRMLYMGLGYAGLPGLARLPVPGALAVVGLLTLWRRYLAARYHRDRGRLVVFDRYTYDALLPPGRRLTPPQRFTRWVWAHACPAPDLVLLLDAPGAVIYERRGESEPALVEAARRNFLSLRHRVPQLQVVDAARPEEDLRADVADRIQRRYAVLERGASVDGERA